MRGSGMLASEWYDRDGGVKAHKAWNDSDGEFVINTVVAGILKVIEPEHVDKVVYSCLDPKTGCLRRRPDNTGSGGPQQHDGWTALAVWLHYRGNAVMARGLLVSAIMRGLYMKTKPLELDGLSWTQKLREIGKPWLIRFPQIWIALIAAAFQNRFVGFVMSKAFITILRLQRVDTRNASALQLRFIALYSVRLSSNPLPLRSFLEALRRTGTSFPELMARDYWDQDSPVISGYRHMESEVVNGL
jgi:hypothetical protein